MSALLHQSLIFAPVSPLPLFILTLKNHPWISALALLSNLALLYPYAEPFQWFLLAVTWLGVGVLFPLLIRRSGRIHTSFGFSFVLMVGLIVGGVWFRAEQAEMGLIEYVRTNMSIALDLFLTLPNSPLKTAVEEQGRDTVLRQIMIELPAGILGSLIFCLWINLLFASQMVRGFLSKSFWANYRNPEWLIFPTIVFAVFYVWGEQALFNIGQCGLKVIILFYGFQGLSVISHFLNRYKILGFGRALVFAAALFLVTPLVLSLGFFDLWFDFRKKVGHS